MVIKIGNAVFKTNGDYPVMLILTQEEKDMIANMDSEEKMVCFAPAEWPEEKIDKWMSS